MASTMANFGGSIPEYYDSIMGPAQFEAFGAELAGRLPAKPPGDVLEIAAGTGRVTRHLRERLDQSVKLVASDLSQAMLELARKRVDKVEFHEADAGKLPFEDARFGAVVCAFGVMFFPDKPAAIREACRVLRKGGTFLFNVWDGLENNPHGRATAEIMESVLPGDPALKGAAMPYLFSDRARIATMLKDAGFGKETFAVVRIACTCPSVRDFATGLIRGTPRGQLLAGKGVNVDDVIEKIAAGLAKIGGAAPFRYTAQALVIEARAA
jgi:ubiquinone/menaquinone biosynthesis C-methylase UbiE